MRRRWGGRALTILFLAAAAVFVALLLVDRWEEAGRLADEVGGFAWSPAPGWLAAALILATLNLFWMGAIWVRLYRAGGGRLPYGRGIRVWMVTNLGRYIPGKLWQLSGLAFHLRRTGESGVLALSSSLAFQVLTLLTGSATGIVLLGGELTAMFGDGVTGFPARWPLYLAGVGLALALLLHPSVVRRATIRLARWLGEEEPGIPAGRELLGTAAALLLAWVLYGIAFWCFLRGLSPAVSDRPLLLTGVFAASYVAGYLVLVAPGGLVVREGAMAGLLAALTPLSAPVAGVLAVAARIWVILAELAGAGLAFVVPGGEGEEAA